MILVRVQNLKLVSFLNIKPIFSLIFLILVVSCQSKNTQYTNPEIIIESPHFLNGDYLLIGQNLYKDSLGNVYFRTIDRSGLNENREVFATYSNKLYYDTIMNNDSIYLELPLKNIIDISSFKKIKIKGLITFYKDKNHSYFHREMAYGGTLHCNE